MAMLFAVLAGFGGITQYTVCNIMVQSDSEPRMRGRAIGILLMAIFGMVPLGSLLVGGVSQGGRSANTDCSPDRGGQSRRASSRSQ